MKVLRKLIRPSKGQVSLLIVLIFQVLFLFFAMVINVGMLVHHKINLQNSVDLAAYYGAMKQAEILNAIAHMNYQIRQSWKLLNFRYHILGTMGPNNHPVKNPTNVQDNFANTADVLCMTTDDLYCVSSTQYNGASQTCINESAGGITLTCRETHHISIDSIEVPDLIGIMPWDSAIVTSMRSALQDTISKFAGRGVQNYKLLTLFITLFRLDSRNRRMVISALADQLSQQVDDFKALNGIESVKEGVEKTLTKNLTELNYQSPVNYSFYNSMGHERCKVKLGPNQPPKWLNQIILVPSGFQYFDSGTVGNPSKRVTLTGTAKGIEKDILPNLADESQQTIDIVNALNRYSNPFINLSDDPNNMQDIVGVEKNPWCMTYSGVKATTVPRLPFMPSSSIGITLKAYGFAKPFGGKIGPWYKASWSNSSNYSDSGKRVDDLLPISKLEYASMINHQGLAKAIGNFSRFPGDTAGIRSNLNKFQYGKGIWGLRGPVDGTPSFNLFRGYLDKLIFISQLGSNLTGELFPSRLDIMADAFDNQSRKLRKMELIGIAPDLFDITYYSIEPNFSSLYKPILKSNPNLQNLMIRGDLGSIEDPMNPSVINIKDQMDLISNPPIALDFSNPLGLYFPVRKENSSPNDTTDPVWGRLLTSWTEKSLRDYSFDSPGDGMAEQFGRCIEPIPSSDQVLPNGATQGECLKGGRTGYSVKLVARKFLESTELKLGGPNTGAGAILNPPPDDW